MSPPSKRILLFGLACATLFLVLWPIPSPATPRWEVRVVDESGQPVQDAIVRLSRQNYSVETKEHEEELHCEENGYAVFPARNLRASLLRRVIGTIRSASGGAHASFGPHAYVLA